MKTSTRRLLVNKKFVYAEKQLVHGVALTTDTKGGWLLRLYSVEEVCEKNGISDVKYFCRAVKKEYGVPPSKLYQYKTAALS